MEVKLANKVNVSDMRKPASDVAGIEEVNAKQDKLTITPADDSKVVHKTGTEEIGGQKTFDVAPIDKTTGNPYITKDGVPSLPSDVARTGQANTFSSLQTFSQGVKTLQTGSYDDANSLVNEGLYYNTNSSIKNGAGSLTTGYIQVMSGGGEIVRQVMYSDTDGGVIYDRTSQDGGSSWSNWTQIITWDQIPSNMVLNNQDANFTAKLQQNGQDVALANNTIYRNPDTGSVSETNTFTQPQTFSIAPTITDASKDKGDTQAATMADLKSVEKSAWHQLALPDTDALKSVQIIYQISGANLNLVGMGTTKEIPTTPIDNWLSLSFLDFSPLVKSFKASDWVIATNLYDSSLGTSYYNDGSQKDFHVVGGTPTNSRIVTLERTSGDPVSLSLDNGNYVLFGGSNGFANLSVNEFK